MKKNIILAIIYSVILFGCRSIEPTAIDISATGNNGDGTVNIEYKKDGKFYSMFHITVDSLLTFIRENPIINSQATGQGTHGTIGLTSPSTPNQ